MKSIYLLIAITLILLGCEDVAAPSDNSLGGQIPSATDINDLNNEGAILQGQIVDTISNSFGEIEIHIKDYELVSDKSTGEIDTVFAEDSLVYTEAEWVEEVGEIEDVKDSILASSNTIEILNEYSNSVYIEVWSGVSLEYNEGSVVGYQVKRVQRLIEVSSQESQALLFEEGQPHLIVVGLIRDGYYRFLTSENLSSTDIGIELKLNNQGSLSWK